MFVLTAVNLRTVKFIGLFLFWTASLIGSIVEDGIKQMTLNHRYCLKSFFDHATKHDQAAHVLFFENKPACLIAIILKHQSKPYTEIVHLKGWHAFKRYEHFFPHPNFIFSEDVVTFSDDFKVLHIYILNKQSLTKCLEQHIHLFREELGAAFSVSAFISKLEEGISLPSLLHKDEMLMGILLGFGEESSKAFKKADNDSNFDNQCFDLKRPKGCKIAPVVFMGNPNSKEVKKLCSVYENELEGFWEKYEASKDLLKMILQCICTDS
jgi:hypothetical protein